MHLALMPHPQTCLVTGGSMGIGLAICQRFASAGFQVYNLDIQPPKQPEANIHWLKADMGNSQQVTQAVQQAIAQSGAIHTLVCNAGIHLSANIEQTSEAQLDQLFAINVKGAVAAIQGVLPGMCEQHAGSILLISSDQAIVGKTRSFAYGLSKAALASIAKTTALDYAQYGIRANAICPGTIETPLYHQAINNYIKQSGADETQVHQQEAALQPLGRLGRADEVAELVFFLASDKAAFITGSLQVIDGGYTAQ